MSNHDMYPDNSTTALPSLRSTFTTRFTKVRPMLLNCAMKVLRNRADAEDVVQQAALLAWQNLHTVREDQYFTAWLYRITFHAAVGEVRKRKNTCVRSLTGDLVASQPSPEQVVCSQSVADQACRLINTIPRGYRVPLRLYCSLEEPSFAEIGQRLGLTASSAKLKIWRARQMVQQKRKSLWQS